MAASRWSARHFCSVRRLTCSCLLQASGFILQGQANNGVVHGMADRAQGEAGGQGLPERRDEIEQGRALVAHFMDQGRSDAVAHHPLAGHADNGHRIFTTARQGRLRPAYRRAVAAVQVTDDERWVKPAPGRMAPRRWIILPCYKANRVIRLLPSSAPTALGGASGRRASGSRSPFGPALSRLATPQWSAC